MTKTTISTKTAISTIIKKAADELDLYLPSSVLSTFEKYYELLIKHGEHVNLTAIKTPEDVATLHFLDSLMLLNTTDFKNKTVIDIGSGAGFPGIPIKIVEPSIKITLLDATKKRITFLTELCKSLEIDAVCFHARAEEFIRDVDVLQTCPQRESYDIVVSRAVAPLNILCELCLPYININGYFPVMKSINSDDEIIEALNAIKTLGAEIIKTIPYTIPGTDITHRIILIHKKSETPEKYPRRFARIEKKPL